MGTSLLTNQDKARLPGLYATEDVGMQDKIAWVRLGHLSSGWVWYVMEYDGVDLCFGLVEGFEIEFGYFSLSELESVRYPLGKVVRDDAFKPCSVAELLK